MRCSSKVIKLLKLQKKIFAQENEKKFNKENCEKVFCYE